jgi:hypothetical protein
MAETDNSQFNNRDYQEIAILALHLLQICMVYINTLLVQEVLSEKEWLDKMQPEDFRGLTPLFMDTYVIDQEKEIEAYKLK